VVEPMGFEPTTS